MEENRIETFIYGHEHESQFGRIIYRDNMINTPTSLPVIVLIHGGFWKEKYHIDNSCIDNLIPFFLNFGIIVCTIEYRRVGGNGGFPMTNNDIISALTMLNDQLCKSNLLKFDQSRISILGHSAGGTLALWACTKLSTRGLPFTPHLCVAIAPIGDLLLGQNRKLSDDGNAIELYIGSKLSNCNDTTMKNFMEASPSNNLPIESKYCLIITGDKDVDVPSDIVELFYEDCIKFSQNDSNTYTKNNPYSFLKIIDADHYDLVDPSKEFWFEYIGSKILPLI